MDFQNIILIVVLAILAETTYISIQVAKRIRPVKSAKPIFVDTSVLIDGRILMIAETGFMGGSLVVPRSVVGELQFLADNADHEKRARARHGLDVVKALQELPTVDVEILQDGNNAEEGVDNRLLKLAKKHDGAVLTIDYNLNKVAAVEDIKILNINELAQKLRMSYLPGERMTLELVQQGQDSHQGVGYLPDGTMVVVEQASKLVGKKVEIEFIRALQTAAGKMMFARLTDSRQASAKKSSGHKSSGGKKSANGRQRKSSEDRLIGLVDQQ